MAEFSRAVFLSYASQDAEAAWRICEALRAAGIEVWFDQSDLRGGDLWDQKIRSQIKDCALFVPIISANSKARAEGYFRREWKLAVDRTHDMADGEPFLVPVIIDDTEASHARAPEAFRAVQWTRLQAGVAPTAFVEHISALLRDASLGLPQLRRPSATGTFSAPIPPTTAAMPHPKAPPKIWAFGLIGLAAAVILVATGYFQLRRSVAVVPSGSNGLNSTASQVDVAPPSKTAPARPRIAVLPFENLSPDPNNAFFTDGMHEEILTTLANHAPGLEVISNTTMSTYRGKLPTVQTLAHDLHCAYVLEGAVRREGSEVRLTLQLIDARNDSHLWAEDYDRKLVSAMALEREVAAAVTSQLSLKFAGTVQGEGLSSNPQAYDLYLKARSAANAALAAGSLSGLQEAEGLLDQAISTDPSFARAYLERMSLRLQLFLQNYVSPEEALPRAQSDLASAQRLAPSDPVVTAFTAAMAYALQDYDHALQLFSSAEAVGLADPELLNWKSELLFAMGRYRDATALSSRLADLDPKNVVAQIWWVYMLNELHQYQEAIHVIDVLGTRHPRGWDDERAQIRGYIGGDFEPRHALNAVALKKPWRTAQDAQSMLGLAMFELPIQHRFKDFRVLLDESPIEDWRSNYRMWPLHRVGMTPVADLRGWNDLMLGDQSEARRDGQRIMAFLKRMSETRWNKWYRDMLHAEAELFMGDPVKANQTAAAAVELTRSTPDISDQMNAYVWSTEILAWTDRKAEAARRVDQLSTSIPGLWPGEIIADPIYSMPLGPIPAYQALVARLREEIRPLKFN